MAIAKYVGICVKCNREFEIRRRCANRTSADNFEVWAAENATLCSACAAKERDAQNAERVAKTIAEFSVVLPEITGVSEKQIKYANDVRAKYINRNYDKFRDYWSILRDVEKNLSERGEEILAQIVAEGKTLDESKAELFDMYNLGEMHLIMTATEARVILDALARW